MEKDTDFDANFNTESLSRRSFFLKCAGPRYLWRDVLLLKDSLVQHNPPTTRKAVSFGQIR